MNTSPKLQTAAPLTFSAQSINSSDFISSFLLFYLICRFLTYVPIFIFFFASRNPFSHSSFHQISACLHFFTLFFSSCIFFFIFFFPSFFLFSFFVSLYFLFSVNILSFTLLLLLYVYCVRNTLVIVQFTSIFLSL